MLNLDLHYTLIIKIVELIDKKNSRINNRYFHPPPKKKELIIDIFRILILKIVELIIDIFTTKRKELIIEFLE